MSFGWSMAAMAAFTAYTSYEGYKSQSAALRQAKQAAQAQQLASDEANNRANAKRPDVAALMSANVLASKNGQAGTMLTGPSGVDTTDLKLGKSNLLGGS